MSITELDQVRDILGESNTPDETPEIEEKPAIEEVKPELEAAPVESDETPEIKADKAKPDEVVETPDDKPAEVSDELYTMKSFAEAVEIEQADLYNVMVPSSTNGEAISIGNMKDAHEKSLIEIPKLKAEIETQKKTIGKHSEGMTQAQQLSQDEYRAQVEMASVQKEHEDTDWKDLEEFDPGKAALTKQNLQERYNRAQHVMRQAGQQREIEHQTFLNDNYTKLLEMVPEWTDKAVRQTAMEEINTALVESGYTEEQAKQGSDPIAFKLMHELIGLRKEKAASIKTLEAVRKAPKALKTRAVNISKNKETNANLSITARKTGEEKDILAAVNGLLSNQS